MWDMTVSHGLLYNYKKLQVVAVLSDYSLENS